MSLEKIYELDQQTKEYKKLADEAHNRYNYALGDLERERQKFKEVVGIIDPPEPFNLWKLFKEVFNFKYDHGPAFSAGIAVLFTAFIFLCASVEAAKILVLTLFGSILLFAGFCLFRSQKRSRK